MVWIKVDAEFLEHPKTLRALDRGGSAVVHLWVALLSYAKRKITDGRIPVMAIPRIGGPTNPRWRAQALQALLDEGLVQLEDDGETIVVHDYLEWNQSREQVLARAESEAQRKAAKRARARGVNEKKHGSETRGPVRKGAIRASSQITSERQSERQSQITSERQSQITSERQSQITPPSNDNGTLDANGAADTAADASRARVTEYRVQRSERTKPPSEDPPQSSETDPDPRSKKTRLTKTGKARKSLAPLDFAPNDATRKAANELGIGQKRAALEIQAMIDWSHGKGQMRADWQAVFRNWMRRISKDEGLKPIVRDAQWAAHQAALSRARAQVANEVEPPPEVEAEIERLFG